MKSVEELRKEYLVLRNNGEMAMMLGSTCSNCGSTDDVEYHHVVPLHLGGTNRWTNIVPLCNRCHKAAHRGRHISAYVNHTGSGRPSNVSDKVAFKALDMWADGQIGSRKLRELMRLKELKGGGSAISKHRQYEKWCKERGYLKVKNTLDVTATQRTYGFDGGTRVGTITKSDGQTIEIYFNDTGMNDDVMYKVRGTDEMKPFRLIKSGLSMRVGAHFVDCRFESDGQLSFG